MIRSDDHAGKPPGKVGCLKQVTSGRLRRRNTPVINELSTRYVVAIEVVKVISLLRRADVTLVVLTGVIGIILLSPLILIEKLLRDIPLLYGRIERIKEKLKNGEYTEREQFKYDINLIFENAKVYNLKDSFFYKLAEILKTFCQPMLDKLKETKQDADNRKMRS